MSIQSQPHSELVTPSLVTAWQYWVMIHGEGNLFLQPVQTLHNDNFSGGCWSAPWRAPEIALPWQLAEPLHHPLWQVIPAPGHTVKSRLCQVPEKECLVGMACRYLIWVASPALLSFNHSTSSKRQQRDPQVLRPRLLLVFHLPQVCHGHSSPTIAGNKSLSTAHCVYWWAVSVRQNGTCQGLW